MAGATNADLADAIAIVGMEGRFPGAATLADFWRNLAGGVESITFFKDADLPGFPAEQLAHPQFVKAKGVLDGIESFDAGFFGYTPPEARAMDPQHRLFLEAGWAALENAGYDPASYAGSIGVYAGLSVNSYLMANLLAHPEVSTSLGSDKDFLTTRLSYKLNLKGPSMAVQTACSTSLVAVCQACSSLLSYQCDMALAGGVSVAVPNYGGHWYQEGGIMSPDGHCRAFDVSAKGTVLGSGLGVVVLKRFQEAIDAGDLIHAVIRGFAVNNDGALKIGYTAPSVQGQAQAIAAAQALAGVDPQTVTYVEAHGTGTELGDPIEMAALTQAFRASTSKKGFCAVGSVKTNIGHLDTAAGIASLIKTVLALEHRQLPPSLHFKAPNPKIDFAGSPFFVNTKLTDWKADGRRRAGVSSFGIGGTNAHVVLEEAPAREASKESARWQLLTVSARSEAALETATANLLEHLRTHPDLGDSGVADVAYTLHVGRKKFSHARAVVCKGAADATAALENPQDRRRVLSGVHDTAGQQPIVFMFPGQGAQHPNMARELYDAEPLFKQHVDECCERLRPALGFDLRAVLYPAPGDVDAAAERLQETLTTQCALFAVEHALAHLWMSWGVRPHAFVGHSVGEYVAACLSGVLSLDDALKLVVIRGRLMQAAPPGAMVAVPLAEDRVRELLRDLGDDSLSLATVNGVSQCVVAGSIQGIEALEEQLRDGAVTYQRLLTGGAFHSPLMTGVVEPLTAAAREVRIGAPLIPYVSNVTGEWITAADVSDPQYWGRHVRGTVRFSASLDTLLTWGAALFLEVGPGQSLSGLVRQQARVRDANSPAVEVVPSLPSPREVSTAGESVVRALGRLWLAGVMPDWQAYHASERRLRVELPTYPFERKRYWADPSDAAQGSARRPNAAPDRRAELDTWFAIPSWARSQPPALTAVNAGRWLVFLDDTAAAMQLASLLEQRGHTLVRVRPGTGFVRGDAADYEIDPASRSDYDALIADLSATDRMPDAVLHMWSLSGRAADADRADDAFADRCQARGFDSLLYLAQTWGDRAAATNLQIAVVTDPVHDVTGHDGICPEKTTVMGAVRVLPQEYATVSCRLIDVVASEAGFPSRLADQVVAELESDESESVVAYRGIDRWVQTAEPIHLDSPAEQPRRLRDGGVYLITGGYGAIGLEIARYLAGAIRPRLVLVGRGGVPARELWQKHVSLHGRDDQISRRIRSVQALEESGATVLAARADIASEVQMRDVVAGARRRFGRIDGVFHAAGIAGGGMMQLRKPDAVAAVMRPKVTGTRVLERLLADDPPDFMMLCSSLNAVTGGAGQADYCAANAYLDTFARFQTVRSDTFTVSVNWDTWRDAGMAVDARLPGDLARAHGRALERGISPAEGIEILRRCLAATVPQVLVSTSGWLHHGTREAAGMADDATSSASDRQAAGLPLNPRPNLASPYVAPQDDVHRKICDVWREALGVDQVGVDDSFFDLGGHSLLAVQVVARHNGDFGTAIPVAKLYEGLTPAFFADLVRDARPAPLDEAGDADQRQERLTRQKRHQEKRRVARTGQGRLVQ
jgi:acyl transferase domain-containing protein